MNNKSVFLRTFIPIITIAFIYTLLPVFPSANENSHAQSPQGWYQQDSGTTENLNNVCAINNNIAWVVGDNGIILKTTDGGANWVKQNSGTTKNLTSISCVNKDVAWVIGDGSLFLSTQDGGDTWLKKGMISVYDPDTTEELTGLFCDISAVSDTTAWTIGDLGSDQTIIGKTTNGGDDWILQKYESGAGLQYQGIHAMDADNVWVVGSKGSGKCVITKTTNGGEDWTGKSLGIPLLGEQQCNISAVDDETAFVAGWYIHYPWTVPPDQRIYYPIAKTTDAGETWTKQGMGTEDFLILHGVSAVDANTAWVAGQCNLWDSPAIIKTIDGTNWFRQRLDNVPELYGAKVLSICAANANSAWAVGEGGLILHTSDGGGNPPVATWYFAEGCTREGFSEWLCLQNPGVHDVDVHAIYMLFGGSVIDTIHTIPASSRASVSINNTVGPGQDVSVMLWSDDYEFYAERAMYFSYKQGTQGYSWDGGHVTVGAQVPRNHWYFAEGCTRTGFEEWLCIQNPSENETTVGIDYIAAGAYTAHKDYNVPANSRITVFVNGDMGPGQDVSCHVYSAVEYGPSPPIVVERPMYFNYGAVYNPGFWSGGHIVMGTDSPRKEWYFAEGCTRPGFEEWICIQNPNLSPANLDVTYNTDIGPIQKEYEIPANSRGTLSINAEVGQDRDVSCHISSDQDIICERPLYFNYTGHGAPGWAGGSDELGVSSPKKDWYFAEGCTDGSFQEWICIQNTGSDDATVDVTYNISGMAPITKPHTVPPGRYTINVSTDAGPGLHLSAHVSSDKPVICERPMYFDYNGWQGGHCATGYAP